MIASSSETSSADENGRKLDMILSEISKLNSKLSEKIKPRKQGNELPKSDELSVKLINQLNRCKTIDMNPLIIFLTFPRKNHLFVTYVSHTLLKVALTPLGVLPIISKKTISISLLRYFYEISVI